MIQNIWIGWLAIAHLLTERSIGWAAGLILVLFVFSMRATLLVRAVVKRRNRPISPDGLQD
jgi:hypothetical protein